MNLRERAEKKYPTKGCYKTQLEPISEHEFEQQRQLAYIAGFREAIALAAEELIAHDNHCGHHECHTLTLEENIRALASETPPGACL